MTRSQETGPDNVWLQKLVIQPAEEGKGVGTFFPFGLDAFRHQQTEDRADPAAGLRAQVYAPNSDGQADKENSKRRKDDNPALAAVVVGAVLKVRNGRDGQQFVVQQEMDGGKNVLLRDDKIKDAVGTYSGTAGDTLKKIDGADDLYTDGRGAVVRLVREKGNRLERMYGYSIMSKDAVAGKTEIDLPNAKSPMDESTFDSKHETVTKPDGTVIEMPLNYIFDKANTLPYSNKYPPESMRVTRSKYGEALLVDPDGAVIRAGEGGVLQVLPDVKVKRMGNDMEPATKYIDTATGKLNLPTDRGVLLDGRTRYIKTPESVELVAYQELAGASRPYTPDPGAVMRQITIDGKTYYRQMGTNTVTEREPDGSFRERIEFSLRRPYPTPRGESLPQSGDILIPGGQPAREQGARPERGDSVGALGGVLPADALSGEGARISAQDLNQLTTRIRSLRESRGRTAEEVQELAALEMVHSQLKGDEKARVEFAERLAELRKGGLAGIAIVVTAALQWYATQNGKQPAEAAAAVVH